jgi:hypothetical protein
VIRKLTLAAGFAAGYVLGAKAGEQRYRQIEAKFRELAGMPAVQDLTSNLAETASSIGDKAKETVNEKVAAVGDKVTGKDDVVDLSTGSKSRTGARTTSTPMAGAAASATAPDVP